METLPMKGKSESENAYGVTDYAVRELKYNFNKPLNTKDHSNSSVSNDKIGRYHLAYNISTIKFTTSQPNNGSTLATSSTTKTGGAKEKKDDIVIIILAIVILSVIGGYVLYLCLLVAVRFWLYIFHIFNCHDYVQIIE